MLAGGQSSDFVVSNREVCIVSRSMHGVYACCGISPIHVVPAGPEVVVDAHLVQSMLVTPAPLRVVHAPQARHRPSFRGFQVHYDLLHTHQGVRG